MKSLDNGELDSFDKAILNILSHEGRLPVTELANRVGLSNSPCQARLKRLLEENYILGFKADLNPMKLRMEHVAFTTVKLSDTTEEGLDKFNKAVVKIAEVESCHMIASEFDYILKVRTSNIKTYRKVLGESISALPNVSSTSTFVSMESVKDRYQVSDFSSI